MSLDNDLRAEEPWSPDDVEIDVGFPDLLSVLMKRKFTVIFIALLVAALSFASASKKETTYSSDGSVLVASSAQPSSSAQVLATEKQLAMSRAVAELVKKDTKSEESPDVLRAGLSVSVPLDTQILDFKYTDASAPRAARMAQAFIDAYLQYRAQLLQNFLKSSQDIGAQSDSLRREYAAAQTAVTDAPTAEAREAAEAHLNALLNQIQALDQKRTTFLSSASLVASSSASPAAPAVENPSPVVRSTAVGLVAGLVLGCLAAFGLEAISRRRVPKQKRVRRQKPPRQPKAKKAKASTAPVAPLKPMPYSYADRPVTAYREAATLYREGANGEATNGAATNGAATAPAADSQPDRAAGTGPSTFWSAPTTRRPQGELPPTSDPSA